MQKDYKNISFEELVRDESFRDWVIFHDTEKAIFWEKWMADNPDSKSNILFAKALLENLEDNDIDVSDDEIESIVETIISEEKPRFKLWNHKLFRMAASVLFMLGLGLIIYKLIADKSDFSSVTSSLLVDSERMVENSNKTNHVVSLYLEDGSKIQLYPKSSVKYPNPFDAKKREVFLNGKAFFDVAKNAEKPFWVHTYKISTRVLGTSFMVSYFEGDQKAKVQVKTGKVSVYTQKETERSEKQDYLLRAGVVLTPNQQVLFDTDDNRLTKSIVEEPVQITTVEKFNFKFEEVPLKDVLAILEKAYGISFNYDEKKIQNCYITANIEKESLYEKLNLICRITNSTYEVVDAQVIIFSKGCD
jgi:transmembrane sensor